jgi:hypothetical protein
MPECISDYEKVEDQARLWYDSGAEQWTDKYISQLGDHTQWAQTLLYDLFKDVKNKEVKKEDFSCDAPGSKCYLARSCGEFSSHPFSLYFPSASILMSLQRISTPLVRVDFTTCSCPSKATSLGLASCLPSLINS